LSLCSTQLASKTTEIVIYYSVFLSSLNNFPIANGLASFTGLIFAAQGVFPLFSTYHLHKHALPLSTLVDQQDFRRSTQLVNDTLSLCYMWDLENAVLLNEEK
jgi:hypothetical protein